MDVERRLELITRNTEEVVTVDELRAKLETGERLKGYIGYEPSGLFHIGWVIWARKVADLVDAGVDFTILEATWHAWINGKLGGRLEAIHQAAEYMRHSFRALGLPVERIRFLKAEDLVSDTDYWATLIRVAKNTTLTRVKRALTIMGRREEEANLDSSMIIYPFMQVTDIIHMDLDIALGGMDQRRAHMLQRDIAPKLGAKKVIAIHTPLLTSLQGLGRAGGGGVKFEELEKNPDLLAQYKMTKSRPETTILIHDPPEQIERKIGQAYCPPREARFNPVMEINKYILFTQPGFVLRIDRPEKYGGPLEVASYEELEHIYTQGKLHPADLKKATAQALSEFLEPVRRYFRENREAREQALLIARLQGVTLAI